MADIELARNCNEATAFDFDVVQVKEKSSRRVLSFDDDDEDNFFCESKFRKLDFGDSEDERDSFSSLDSPDSGISSSSPSQQCLDDSFADISAPLLHADEIPDVLEHAVDSPRQLVADFSRPCHLPTVPGRHGDLAAISPATLASVLAEQKRDRPEVTIVDCRYPYEFAGGHIRGAKNLYSEAMVREEFLEGRSPLRGILSPSERRQIVVFHCEFSIERGPGLLRFLRAQDRALNGESYPALHHPEIYILEGGYCAFYEHCRRASRVEELCEGGYRPMVDEAFCEQLKFYRRETKTSKKHASSSRRFPRNKMAARSKSRLFT